MDTEECTENCTSIIHGDIITAALTKSNVSDEELCSYLAHVCNNCERVRDSVGKNALHVAVSCGRIGVVRWLICSRHADINARDTESGYTPLHRSFFYGKIHIAMELLKLGANITSVDSENLTPLDIVLRDNIKPPSNVNEGELYCWGSNTNMVFGTQPPRSEADLFELFHKEHPDETITQVCIDKFHMVIVAMSGNVYSCGHGIGGRLGLGFLNNTMSPIKIQFNKRNDENDKVSCEKASISRDHSIFLSTKGKVFTCGLNTHHVLGLSPAPKEILTSLQIKHLPHILGVCANRYHSVAWNEKVLFTWGLNAGQLGHDRTTEKYVILPKTISAINTMNNSIKMVAASDGATAIYTKMGDIYVLHEYQCRKIVSKQLDIVQLSIIGGKLDSATHKELAGENCNEELKIIALTNGGKMILWQESNPHPCKCVFSNSKAMFVRQVSFNGHGILFVNNEGEAFKANIKNKPRNLDVIDGNGNNKKKSFHKFLEKGECITLKLSKFRRVTRAIYICSDPNANDFCVIQVHPYKQYECNYPTQSQMKQQLETLYEESFETDHFHDVIFQIGYAKFVGHKFIIASQSSYLEKLMANAKPDVPIILNDVNADIFEQFLKFVYTGTCDLLKEGELKADKLRQYCEKDCDGTAGKTRQYPITMLRNMANKFKCEELHKALREYYMLGCIIKHDSEIKEHNNKVRELTFDSKRFPQLQDITIKCQDNKEVRAHKCILIARSEYFYNMFSMKWGAIETTSLSYPKSVVETLLEFIYSDKFLCLENAQVDHLAKVLMLADELFILRLKEQCEYLLSEQINLRNALQIIEFAHVYNCENLKYCCENFIASNLPHYIDWGVLEDLRKDIWKGISDTYCKIKPKFQCRIVTPYSSAEEDQIIKSVHDSFPVDLDEEVVKTEQKTRHRHRPRHKSFTLRKSLTYEETAGPDSVIQFPDVAEVEIVESSKTENLSDRLKAIKSAQNTLKNEKIEFNFTRLSSSNDINDSGISLENFPVLDGLSITVSPNQNNKFGKYKKMTKISQKERKRLSSETDCKSPNSSLLSESPKNPWKLVSEVPIPTPSKTNIDLIISEEKKQKENLVKNRQRLLLYTQIEDKAIDDLHKFYNSEHVNEEIITIKRVAVENIAQPVWVGKSK